DLFILGGGGILFDGEAETYMREVSLAHEEKIPVVVYAISAGPLTERKNQNIVKQNIEKCALVTVRDRQGQRLLEDIGIHREIIKVTDPALLLQESALQPEIFLREGINFE